MSKKQLGAAPGDETSPEAGNRSGWFGRLRAQPGFRAAAVAFVLTVVLGIGSTVAYAYWGQWNTVSQSVTTVRASLPVVSAPTCIKNSASPTRIEWTAPAGMPSDASYIVRISTSKATLDYAFPISTTRFEPSDLRVNGQALHSWMGIRTGTITVSTGFLAPGVVPPGVVDPVTQVLAPSSKSSDPTKLYSWSGDIAWFRC